MARLEYHTCPIVYASVLQRCLYNQLKAKKDKEITRLKRELNKVNNDLAKKKEELKSTRSELSSRLRIIKKKRADHKTDRGTKQITFRTAWGYKYNEPRD